MQADTNTQTTAQAETVQTVKTDDWISNRVLTLQALKKRTEQQNLLIELFAIENKTALDVKKLNAIVKAERASERAKNAMLEAKNLIQSEKYAEKKTERKARDRELFNAAGLLILAGLVDTKTGKPTIDKAELLGALLSLANVSPTNPKRAEWQTSGAAKLKELEANNAKNKT